MILNYRSLTRPRFALLLVLTVGILQTIVVPSCGQETVQERHGEIPSDPNTFSLLRADFVPPAGEEITKHTIEVNSVQVKAEMKILNRINRPIDLHLTLSNKKNVNITYFHAPGAEFYLYLTDSESKVVPWTEVGARCDGLFNGSGGLEVLRPNGSMHQDYDLQKMFKITKKGPYCLTVYRPISCVGDEPFHESGCQISRILFIIAE